MSATEDLDELLLQTHAEFREQQIERGEAEYEYALVDTEDLPRFESPVDVLELCPGVHKTELVTIDGTQYFDCVWCDLLRKADEEDLQADLDSFGGAS